MATVEVDRPTYYSSGKTPQPDINSHCKPKKRRSEVSKSHMDKLHHKNHRDHSFEKHSQISNGLNIPEKITHDKKPRKRKSSKKTETPEIPSKTEEDARKEAAEAMSVLASGGFQSLNNSSNVSITSDDINWNKTSVITSVGCTKMTRSSAIEPAPSPVGQMAPHLTSILNRDPVRHQENQSRTIFSTGANQSRNIINIPSKCNKIPTNTDGNQVDHDSGLYSQSNSGEKTQALENISSAKNQIVHTHTKQGNSTSHHISVPDIQTLSLKNTSPNNSVDEPMSVQNIEPSPKKVPRRVADYSMLNVKDSNKIRDNSSKTNLQACYRLPGSGQYRSKAEAFNKDIRQPKQATASSLPLSNTFLETEQKNALERLRENLARASATNRAFMLGQIQAIIQMQKGIQPTHTANSTANPLGLSKGNLVNSLNSDQKVKSTEYRPVSSVGGKSMSSFVQQLIELSPDQLKETSQNEGQTDKISVDSDMPHKNQQDISENKKKEEPLKVSPPLNPRARNHLSTSAESGSHLPFKKRRMFNYVADPETSICEDQGLPRQSVINSNSSDKNNTSDQLCLEESEIAEIKVALTQDEDGDFPLHIAVAQENVPAVRKYSALLKKGGKSVVVFNKKKQTPLHLAVVTDHITIVSMLLKEGASVNCRNSLGYSSVHLAAKGGYSKCLHRMIIMSTEPTSLDKKDFQGYSPLHLAVQGGHLDVIQLLIQYRADINIQDGKSGRTALFHAAESNQLNVVDVLLKAKAKVNVLNYAGVSAVMAASGRGHKDVVTLLMQYGADTKGTAMGDLTSKRAPIRGATFNPHRHTPSPSAGSEIDGSPSTRK